VIKITLVINNTPCLKNKAIELTHTWLSGSPVVCLILARSFGSHCSKFV